MAIMVSSRTDFLKYRVGKLLVFELNFYTMLAKLNWYISLFNSRRSVSCNTARTPPAISLRRVYAALRACERLKRRLTRLGYSEIPNMAAIT